MNRQSPSHELGMYSSSLCAQTMVPSHDRRVSDDAPCADTMEPKHQQMPGLAVMDFPQQILVMQPLQQLQHPAYSESQAPFVPNVEEDRTPRVGMLVDSIEEAYNIYNTYAKATSFGIRRSPDTKRKNEVVWKRFVCSKEGLKVEKLCFENTVQRRVTDTRENCGAELQVKKNNHGQWFVCKFVVDHTHLLTSPKKAHLLCSHRVVTAPKKNLIDSFNAANILTCSQMKIFQAQALGNPDLVGFTEKEVRNYARDKKKAWTGKDGQRLYEHFKHLKETRRSTIFSIELDSKGHVKHVFWTDHIFRALYTEFGDVVAFDTTYKTNKYELVFGIFTGVNHHGQSTIFGCGLISDDLSNSRGISGNDSDSFDEEDASINSGSNDEFERQ